MKINWVGFCKALSILPKTQQVLNEAIYQPLDAEDVSQNHSGVCCQRESLLFKWGRAERYTSDKVVHESQTFLPSKRSGSSSFPLECPLLTLPSHFLPGVPHRVALKCHLQAQTSTFQGLLCWFPTEGRCRTEFVRYVLQSRCSCQGSQFKVELL